MKPIGNKFGLPKALYRALCHDGYTPGEKHTDISVTRLISSPRIVQLSKRHAHEMEIEASDRVWSLLGQSIHSVLEKAATDDCRAEERLYTDVLGWTVSGQIDLYEEKTLNDFKVTSVYSFLLGDKFEWEAQLNLGAHLLRQSGREVERLQIIAILRDWTPSKVFERDYPQYGLMVKPIKLWTPEAAQFYLEERVKLHQQAEQLSDNDLPVCSPGERWSRPDSYAVIKNDNKKASIVKPTRPEADTALSLLAAKNPKDKFRVEHRKGQEIRCSRYCQCAKWCNWWQANKSS